MSDKAKPFGYVTSKRGFVRGDLMDQYAVKDENETVSRRLAVDSFKADYGKKGLVQPLYNPEALARVLEINTYHYRACRTKARDIAGLGWVLNPVTEEPDERQKERVDDFFDGMSQPLSTVLDKAMLDFEAVGYCSIELVREGYVGEAPPMDLVHIPSHTMRIHQSGRKACQIRGNKRRWFKMVGVDADIDYETGEEREPGEMEVSRRASEVIWMVNYTPRSDYYGLPDHIPSLGAIHGDLARRDYNISFFDNFGVPSYAVFVTGNFDPGAIDDQGRSELENAIEEHFQELSKNPHSTLILTIPTRHGDSTNEIKVSFQPLAVETKEASFRLYRKDNRDEVLASHGVPPYRLGIAETGSLGGDTADESTEIYKRSIIEPRQEVIESIFNMHIMGTDEDVGLGAIDYWWELAEIDTTDEKHDMEMIESLFRMGAISPNQIAAHFSERFGLTEDDHPALDARYVDGKGVTMEIEDSDVEKVRDALKSLQDRVLKIATKGMSAEELRALKDGDW